MNAQVGMDINERARRALTRIPPSVKLSDALVADVADAIRGAMRSAYQHAAVVASSRVHDTGDVAESQARRDEVQTLSKLFDALADETR